MASDNRKHRITWLPFVIFMYLETIRRAGFYVFGWAGRGQALGIVALLVTVQLWVDYYYPSKIKKAITTFFTLGFIGTVWVANRAGTPGGLSIIRDFIFGLPNFDLGSMSPAYYATFSFFVVFFYALIVFLLTSVILERKSFTEIFTAGILLLAAEIVASDQGILRYALLNALFGVAIFSQANFLRIESDTRVRFPKGTGLNTGMWAGTTVAVVAVVIAVAAVMPASQAKADFGSVSRDMVENVINKKALRIANSDSTFDTFWAKQQGFKIQGKVPVQETVVMYVKSPVPTYWRGESVDFYTGEGWESSLTSQAVNRNEFENPFSNNVSVRKINQVFSLTAGMSSQVVFSSGAPAFVGFPPGSIAVDEGDNIYTSSVKPGISYEMVSYIPQWEPAKLRRTPQEYPMTVKTLYLQQSGKTPQRVRQLAKKLTAAAKNPYDKVKVIENYLSTNYPYELNVAPAPAKRDIADYFLFDMKKGYCTYHSTAMVVMLRSIGIPARWIKGFATGTLDENNGVYQVSMANAHAWVEVYFADYGWVPFEPTSGFSFPGREVYSKAEPAAAEHPAEAEAKALPTQSPEDILARPDNKFPWGIVFTVCGFVALGAGIYLWRTKKMFYFGSGDKIRDTYISLVNLLAFKGFPRNEAQTPLEYARGLADRFPEDYEDFILITDAYLRDKYGSRKLTKKEVDEIKDTGQRLADKWLGKRRD